MRLQLLQQLLFLCCPFPLPLRLCLLMLLLLLHHAHQQGGQLLMDFLVILCGFSTLHCQFLLELRPDCLRSLVSSRLRLSGGF